MYGVAIRSSLPAALHPSQFRRTSDAYAPRSMIAAGETCHRIDVIQGGCELPSRLHGAMVALGNFDGLHKGHQAVVSRAIEMARTRGVPVIVSTFDPHPTRYFRPDAAPFRLSTIEQRRRWLAAAGVDAMMVFPFGGTLAGVTPHDFVDRWLADVGGVVTGMNFNFGRGRAGDVRLLASLARERNLACSAVEPVATGGAAVSSSRIRAAVRDGDCALAAELLSRPYTIESIASPADAVQRRLQPTRTLITLGDYARPAPGRYAARVSIAGMRGPQTPAHVVVAGDAGYANLDFAVREDARAAIDRVLAIEFLHRHD